ncbi:hypothetical protein JCM6882_004383 [Rhodosporidiobolus microsporus]
MPSFSNLRKRASASLDAYTASAAGPPLPQQQTQTRAQRALSRLSRLKIPRRSSVVSQADFSFSPPSRAQTPISPISPRSPTPWQRPNKLRRQSRSLSVSTVLAFSSATSGGGGPKSPFSPTPALLEQEQERLRDEQDVERLKRTISYPILRHASSPVDAAPGFGWGIREATQRYDEHTETLPGERTRPSTALSKRLRSNTASSTFGLTFPPLAVDEEDDPFAPYINLANNTSGALNLDLDVSLDSLGDSTFSSSSLSSYGDDLPDEGPTSRFSMSTMSISPASHEGSAPPRPPHAWRESDDSLVDVDLDFETVHSTLTGGAIDFPSPLPSPTLYKNQPSVSSVPLTPTSPLSPFPRSLKSQPSLAWSTSSSATSVKEDVHSGRGFSFARTSPAKQQKRFVARSASNSSISGGSFASRPTALPTPPPTPRLEPVFEDSSSFLALPAPASGGLTSPSDLSLFLDELAGQLEKVQEREEERDEEQEEKMDLYSGNNARRSSIPFPTFELFSRSPSPSPSPSPPARPSTSSPSLLFPLLATTTPPNPSSPTPSSSFASQKKRHSSAPFPFALDSPPPARKRVLRRVATRIDVLSASPPETPTRSRFPVAFLGGVGGGQQYSPISSATATPRPSTPCLTIVDAPGEMVPLFRCGARSPTPSSPLASPKRQRVLVFPVEDSEDSVVEGEEGEEGWTSLSAGVEGGRRRSF